MRNINEIIIHCTATPYGRDVSATEIDAWHRERGFAGIGYHFVVRLDGTLQVGRPLDKAGAHCKGHNAHSIGIAYVGGLDVNGKPADTRTEEQKIVLQSLVCFLCSMHPSIKQIRGHRDYSNKECPCFDAQKEYSKFVM